MAEIIKSGTFIKVFFKGGLSAQGTVVDCSESSLLLKAESCEDLLFINNPTEDLLMIRIFVQKSDQPDQQSVDKPIDHNRSEFQPEQNLDIKNRSIKLVDLKLKQVEQERKNVSEKMKSFEPTPTTKLIEYGQPKFTKQHSGEKASRSALSNIERMREVQRKNQIRRGLRKM